MSDVLLSGECFVREPVLLEKQAPDFKAQAYYRGERVDVKLADFRGKWVVLFFYAHDFTFV